MYLLVTNLKELKTDCQVDNENYNNIDIKRWVPTQESQDRNVSFPRNVIDHIIFILILPT